MPRRDFTALKPAFPRYPCSVVRMFSGDHVPAMNSTVEHSVQRLRTVTPAHAQALAKLLIDCVAGGASVSFMHPLSMTG
jgi:hypothetical protein